MSLQVNRRADRVDRLVLTVGGGLAVLAGAAALAVGAGAFGDEAAEATLLGPGLQDAVDRHGVWFALGATVALGFVAALALRWLVFLMRPAPTASTLHLTEHDLESPADGAAGLDSTGDVPGRVTLDPRALVGAVEREVQALPGVASASVRIPDRRPVEVHAAVDLLDGSDVATLLRAVDDDVRTHVRAATGLDDLRVLVELTPVAERPRRVT